MVMSGMCIELPHQWSRDNLFFRCGIAGHLASKCTSTGNFSAESVVAGGPTPRETTMRCLPEGMSLLTGISHRLSN